MERYSDNELSARKFSVLSLFAYQGAGLFCSFLGFLLKFNNQENARGG